MHRKQTLVGNLRALAHDFADWRRQRWPFRVVVLLVLFSTMVIPRLLHRDMIVLLVQDAIQALYYGSEPSVVTQTAEFYEVQEAHRLQELLRQRITQHGTPGASAADEERLHTHLSRPAKDADLEYLVESARRLDLVRLEVTARRIRRDALQAAVTETAAMVAPYKAEVDAALDEAYAWPDYTSLDTWKRGFQRVLGQLYRVVLLGSPANAAFLLFVWIFSATSASGWLPRRPGQAGAVAALAVTLLLIAAAYRHPHYTEFSGILSYGLIFSGIVCYGAVIGHVAGRVAPRLFPVPTRRIAGGVGLGCTLLWPVLSLSQTFRSGIGPWGTGFPPMRIWVLGTMGAIVLAAQVLMINRANQKHSCTSESA